MRGLISYELSATATGMLDESMTLLHGHVRRNARRIVSLMIALLPLLMLLVGSCRTSQMTYLTDNAYESAERFQAALFPDRANFQGVNYSPAAGYVAQARKFIEQAPQTMMLLTRKEIGYVFGKPDLQRRDADAEVWQYKAAGCVVNFYFYGDKPMSFADIRLTESNLLVRERPSLTQQSSCLHAIDAAPLDSSVQI